MKPYQLLVLAAIFIITSCKKNPNPAKGLAAGVYVVGYVTTSTTGLNIATLWKNDVPTQLPSPTIYGGAQGIAINGNDIYIIGYTQSISGKTVATLWKNGIPTTLEDTSISSVANAITISNNDVYIAGDVASTGVQFKPYYWKNGIATELQWHGEQFVSARAICVSGSDVYVSGYTDTSQSYRDQHATYWKNGVENVLTPTSYGNFGTAEGIAVVNNDVYLAGSFDYAGNIEAMYWKNGIPDSLNNTPNVESYASAIVVKGNYIYLAGAAQKLGNKSDTINNLIYWKSSIGSIPLPIIKQGGFTSPNDTKGMFVDGDDVYVAGGADNQAGYWKNGNFVVLGNGDAYGVAVVP